MTEQALDATAVHLEGIRKALRSLAKHLRVDEASNDESTKTVCSQLEWASSHLLEAVRELRGGQDESGETTEPPTHQLGRGLMEGLRGHTESVAIPEILGFVSSLRKSGVLRINSRDEAFLIQLEEGKVVYAQGDSPPHGELLGEILVKQGSLRQEDLDRISSSDADRPKVLGQALLAEGLVTREALCIALAYQVQALFTRMYVALDAVFQFDEGVQLMAPEDIRLNVTSLLLESARATDEDARDDRSRPPA